MKKLLLSTLTFILFFSTAIIAQKTYTEDTYHSRVDFSATHFGISHVEGIFTRFNATLEAKKEDLTDAVITLTIDVSSINTEVAYRDNDLKSPNYFDTSKYPSITFKSTSFKKVSGKNYKLAGNITIHNVTKPIVFDVVYNGIAVTAMKKPTAGFTITGKLNRLDFGVGGPVSFGISNQIELRSNVEFTVGQ
jgi:polyisoprenoid-binding protein YceI